MKLQNDVLLGKHLHARRRTPKIAPLIAVTVLFTIIPLYHPSLWFSTNKLSESLSSSSYNSCDNAISENKDCPLHYSESNSEEIIQENDEDDKHPLHGSHDLTAATRKKERAEKKRAKHREKAVKTPRKNMKKPPSDVLPQEKIVQAKIIRYDYDNEECDLFSGEWVPNPEGPYYTNATCWAIQEHQNCMKFGRPDTGFMKWRWKPNGCDLSVFDPLEFLDYMSGKSLAFVGDSVARNHMQSMICLLSRVTYPVDASNTTDENFKRWEYRDYNFNISIFWSPYLVRTQRTDPNDVTRPFNLYLDEVDKSWTTQIETFDYVIISAGHWFFRPSMFYVKNRLIGCLYCPQNNVAHRTSQFSYRRAFRTVFRAINSLKNYKGITFLRTFAPSHFEGGYWDKGGDCVRTNPFRSDEVVLEDYSLEMYNIQLDELRIGEKIGRKKGLKFRLFDMTQVMLLRPDGHPSKYGHWPVKEDVRQANDCVHWCLPGPIDTWNDFLLEMLKREKKS